MDNWFTSCGLAVNLLKNYRITLVRAPGVVPSEVDWLELQNCDRYGPGSKPT